MPKDSISYVSHVCGDLIKDKHNVENSESYKPEDFVKAKRRCSVKI